jgi:DNA-binding PadR family transcriptional regulator
MHLKYRMTISKYDKANERSTTVEHELFRGFIRIHILHHAAKGQVFGQALKAELERHGYRLSFGTLYPILHRMEKDGLLARQSRTVFGRVRKYYEATDTGRQMLAKAKEYIHELVDEVLGE